MDDCGRCRDRGGYCCELFKKVANTALADVRYWPKADIDYCTAHVRFSGVKSDMAPEVFVSRVSRRSVQVKKNREDR